MNFIIIEIKAIIFNKLRYILKSWVVWFHSLNKKILFDSSALLALENVNYYN